MAAINDRIRLLIDKHFKEKAKTFAEDCGIKYGTLMSVIGKRNSNPSQDMLEKIVTTKNLSESECFWLISGRGNFNNELSSHLGLVHDDTTHQYSPKCRNCAELQKRIEEQDYELNYIYRHNIILERPPKRSNSETG